ncbi:hypothetical protein DSM104299_03884 [Baekduia alba]|uniref:metallopeptidase TldD-related protein n=1 Tax=Baekduia alba TaxID=2997333 RepID=UPI00233FFD56|nr:metallopeptidase TldD-related protein [Baekduia alba]WCB95142.1 hypothetical protein DSM104299_03884 [Baekduia alba]
MSAPQELVDAALAASVADGCVVVLEEHSAANLRWAASAMTTNGWTSARTMTAIAFRERAAGTGIGLVTRSVQTAAEAAALARAADAASRASAPTEDVSPLVAPYLCDDDWGAEVPRTGPDALAPVVPGLAALVDRWHAEDWLAFGYLEQQRTTTLLATSTGLRRRFDQADGRFELTGKSTDMQRSAWYGAHVPDATAVDVGAAGAELERGLRTAAREVALPPGRYETLLPPAAVADLMVFAYQRIAARDAHDGRTVFARPGGGDRIGERLAALPLTLASDPGAPGLECLPFDVVTAGESALGSAFDNGQPVAPATWIDRGTLTDLVRTRAWARATGAAPRPPAGNLLLSADGATASLADMVASTQRGLLVTSLWYVRQVEPRTLLLTGLTRDGVYLVEDGRITAAVNNFRFNESPIDLLARATEAGRTERTLPRERGDAFRRTAMPALRIPDFHMSTVSAAR